MTKLYIQETFINRDLNSRFGKSDVYEAFTGHRGTLYRDLVKEYGRCTGKIYIDSEDGKSHAIGWVFIGRDRYSDSNDTYLREVWVTLHDAPPTRTTSYHYHYL